MAALTRILFVTLTNDVGSERIVSELGRQGAACAVLGPVGAFAGLVRSVEARFPVPVRFGSWASTLVLRRRLSRAVASFCPDRIVPLDELSALVLRTIASEGRTRSELRNLLVASLGRVEGYEAACHRVPLMKLAARLRVRVPSFSEAPRSGAAGLAFPLMVKRDHSSGCGGVGLARDAVALKRFLRIARLKNAAKQLLARAGGFHHGDAPVLLQQHVRGDLAMRTVVCRDGIVLDGVSFLAAQVHPTKRASTMLKAIDQPEMVEAARRIVAALDCSGFVSFDFILDGAGTASLIEMNPRPIGSTHLGRLFGHDLARSFLDPDAAPCPPGPMVPDTIVALFPKELERDPSSPCLNRTPEMIHDVPRDEPQVLEAYLGHLATLHPGAIDALRARLGVPAPATPARKRGWAGPVMSET